MRFEHVAHALTLGLQVVCVLDSSGNFVRDEFGNLQAEAFERLPLERLLVTSLSSFTPSSCRISAACEKSHVAVQAEHQVRVEGVESGILQRVGTEAC